MVDDLLEGVCVDGENVFILLDLVQEILGDLEHGSYDRQPVLLFHQLHDCCSLLPSWTPRGGGSGK